MHSAGTCNVRSAVMFKRVFTNIGLETGNFFVLDTIDTGTFLNELPFRLTIRQNRNL